METTDIRVLVVSPLAGFIDDGWLGQQWADIAVVTNPAAAISAVSGDRRRFDVVMVDLMWNHFDHEWSFDGLDVLAEMERSDNAEWVVFACQGHGFERDYLDEAYARLQQSPRSQVRGLVLKSNPRRVLDSLVTVAEGGSYVDPELDAYVAQGRGTIHHWFSQSVRLPRFAGPLAAGYAPDYELLADLTGTSKSYLHKSPALFTDMLIERGEVDPDVAVNLATVARWSGEHAHYILSWCRRHGPGRDGLADLVDQLKR